METAITGLGVTLALLCVATAVYIVGNRIARALEARKEEGRREERERCLEIAAREALSARAEGREQGECSALRIKLDINAAKPEPPCSTCGGTRRLCPLHGKRCLDFGSPKQVCAVEHDECPDCRGVSGAARAEARHPLPKLADQLSGSHATLHDEGSDDS